MPSVMRAGFTHLALGLTFIVCTRAATAQELRLSGPLRQACAAVTRRDALPAAWEWSYWLSGGASRLGPAELGYSGGLGAEVTAQGLTFRGPPSGHYGPRRGLSELRVGAWSSAATRPEGGLVEGGLKLHLGALYYASFGTFDFRMGVGSGAFSSGNQSHGSLTLTWGVRSTPERYAARGACEPLRPPRSFGLVSVLRLFATLRRPFGAPSSSEVVFGLELSPSLVLRQHRAAALPPGFH